MHGLVNIQHPGGAPAKSIELKRPCSLLDWGVLVVFGRHVFSSAGVKTV